MEIKNYSYNKVVAKYQLVNSTPNIEKRLAVANNIHLNHKHLLMTRLFQTLPFAFSYNVELAKQTPMDLKDTLQYIERRI